ncbi:helix-turn-helix domain-containing protein [Cohnella sp. GCM10027633]|uniref:helix-turn-helix domain-containing protein n=1 Tax=unclassified Cohnella TaxID=2636738 RepID=UPI003629B007
MNKYLRKYRERKYLVRIMLSINLLIVAVMLASLVTAYWNSKRISLASQREANEKVLSQINYNISYMNETVKNFAISLFYDNNMAHLLFSREEDRFEDTSRINKLNKTIAYNSYIHSIVFYNSKRQQYFTGGDPDISEEGSNLMPLMKDYLEGKHPIYKMQLMPVEFTPDSKHPERKEEVFSLFLYDSLDAYSKSESVLIVNIQPEWLFEKLDMLNSRSDGSSNQIFILDQNREIYRPSGEESGELMGIRNEVYRQLDSSHRDVAQFTHPYRDDKQIVNYMVNPSVNWVIVDVEPYAHVMWAVDELRNVFFTVAIVCFVLAAFASLFIARRLYSPINGLLEQTQRLPGAGSVAVADPLLAEKDELGYISRIYNQMIERIIRDRSWQEDNGNIIESYYHRKLITASPSFTSEDWNECVARSYLRTDLTRDSVIGVLKIDQYDKHKARLRASDMQLLHFAITNVALEMLSGELRADIVNLKGEHLVLLVETGNLGDGIYPKLASILAKAQKTVREYYGITFSASLSDRVPDYGMLTLHYERALDYLMYKMNFGFESVITPQMVQRIADNGESRIPQALEKKLIEAVRSNKREAVLRELHSIREAMAGMSYDAVIQSVLHLGILIKETIREINQNKLSPHMVDLRQIDRLAFENETLDEIFEAYGAILGALSVDQKQLSENKFQVILDTIKEVVQANFSNPSLSLQEIADLLKMSPVYVGRIFKKYETISVADYINEVRMLNAVVLLENDRLQVYEISEMVGFTSQSYFFKLFKKRFGTTPKDYRIKKSLGS